MLERDIERKVGDYATKLGVWHRKFVSPQNRGIPDRVFAYKGVVIFIEFKAHGKKTTPLQEAQIKKIRAVGVRVYVCDNVDDGKKIIDQLIAWTEL
jgi:hypothetical protein